LHVVGIDTSTFTGGIALLRDGQVVAEYSAYVTRRNSESLMAVLKNMLRDMDWSTQRPSRHCSSYRTRLFYRHSNRGYNG